MPEPPPSPLAGAEAPEAPVDVVLTDDAAISATAPVGVATPGRRRRRFNVTFWLSVGWLALVGVLTLAASILPLPDYSDTTAGVPRSGPSLHHLLGVDEIGRDILTRVIYGGRVSLVVAFTSVALGILVGGALGLIAGFYGGRIETGIMGATNVLLAFPALVLALAIVTFLGQNMRNVILAIAFLSIAPIARIVRASTLMFSRREFVVAAEAQGATKGRIMVREIIPNLVVPTMSFALIGVAVAIVAEGTLAFLALSVPPPTPTWGGMIAQGFTVIQEAPHISLVPSAVMFLTVLSLNFIGDSLRTLFDVREISL